ncbi:MAG: c-type cytochrome [Candidatus Korobacteraceae bacterium]|jgi:mono/diheme cytochrome c family protein
MKRYTVFVSLLALASTLTWAQDGAKIYSTKCAGCHGAGGEGKGTAFPKLKGIKLSQEEIVGVLTNGGLKKPPHTKPVAGLTAAQAKDVAGYVKTLK